MNSNLSAIALNQIAKEARKRLVRMHFEANVGHLGGNLSCIDALITIFHNLASPRDEIILSKGHSAGALYATLWSMGLIEDSELKTFHGDGSRLAGHPPAGTLPRVRFGTGSLGHGFSIAAGIALSAKLRGTDQQTYCLMSDGEWQEGSTWEALIFAHHHGLSNLHVFIDKNGLQGFGSTTDVAGMEKQFENKLRAFTPNVHELNGHNFEELLACNQARKSIKDSKTPSIFVCRTIKGHGWSSLENKMESHYLPISSEDFEAFNSGYTDRNGG